MSKNITIFCVGLFLASCNSFELSGIQQKTIKSLDNTDPEYVCLGSENEKLCLENMRLVKELEKQNIKIMSELKEQRREIQILRRGLSQQCVERGGIVVGNDCLEN